MRAISFLVLCVLVGCDAPKEASKPEVQTPAPGAKVVVKEKPKKEVPKKEVPKVIEPEPQPERPKSFAESWLEATAISERLDAAEPESTTKAMGLLTALEKVEISQVMVGDGGIFLAEIAPKLRRLGLRAWVDRASRHQVIECVLCIPRYGLNPHFFQMSHFVVWNFRVM